MQEYVEFTKEMKRTHKILIPAMLPIHFHFLQNILCTCGYEVELLQNEGSAIIDEGLKNIHNDTCYPALLVIGQMIDALKSGRYDIYHIALVITQTGGGCRASNYIYLLRKALVQAGFAHVPVISVNFSKLERHAGFQLTPYLLLRLLYAFLYGDFLMWLQNQIKPYENIKGSSDAMVQVWIDTITAQFSSHRFLRLKRNCTEIVADFQSIPIHKNHKIKVGIVGEIYMKYSPIGNNHLEAFLLKENCEPVVSCVLDFGLYCLENAKIDHQLYNRHKYSIKAIMAASSYIQRLQRIMFATLDKSELRSPMPFSELCKQNEGFVNKGAKMGEGWLLTAEMLELIRSGVQNIVCCQPFGCLPNHIVAKGMMRKIKTAYPNSNIVSVDYDPSATSVNQVNRLKLMLANAHLSSQFAKQEETTEVNVSTKEFVYEQ